MNMKMMIIIFCRFPSNGAPVEWNWQGKTEELGEKPVPVPLCPPQIPHRLNRDRTRPSAVGGRRLTAWAMARPSSWLVRHSTTRDPAECLSCNQLSAVDLFWRRPYCRFLSLLGGAGNFSKVWSALGQHGIQYMKRRESSIICTILPAYFSKYHVW
jgi:hypothetical protein